jgi:hypothetical protein
VTVRSISINARRQLVCLWCGPVATVLFGVGFCLLARLLPPPSPADSAEAVVAFYRGNTIGLPLGIVVMQIAGALLGPWVVAITLRLRRIEGSESPLAYTNLGLGMLTLIVFALPPMAWQAAAFRLDRDPEIVQALHDLGWLSFIGVFSFPFVQCLAVAFCILSDPHQRVLPRWLAYFNLWVAIGFAPAATIYFFKNGPMAWNGLVPWWIPIAVFFAWMIVNTIAVRRSIIEHDLPVTAALS